MAWRVLAAILSVAFTPFPALAQPVFDNPLAEPAYYLSARGAAPDAHFRARYEVTESKGGAAPATREIVIDVAADWSLTRDGPSLVLHDFKLNRAFTLEEGDRFTTSNPLGVLTFRVMERQNRTFLQQALNRMGAQLDVFDGCDAESETGVVIPGSADLGVVSWRERRGIATFRCNGRDMGGFTPGDGAAPPPAFWPTLDSVMITHPALHQRMRETGRAPAQIHIAYRAAPGGPTQRAWRLVAIETIAMPYPLNAQARNDTAAQLDQYAPGLGQTALDAVNGRAHGVSPTLENWDAHLRAIARNQGEAAAAMLLLPTLNMFPHLKCNGAHQALFACQLLMRLRTLPDPAPGAVIEIAMAEQSRNSAGAVAAMARAQTSPLRDHPALGAAFALAVLQFDDATRARAIEANLPVDVAALQTRALLALPYNPGYWTDFGDRLGADYEWPNAFLFYDIAFGLPLPEAARGPSLSSKRDNIARIQRDFPQAALPARP